MTALPLISILIAVRNEEQNIMRCLEALAGLDYPTAQLEVLLGNDGSSDSTEVLIQTFIADKPHFQLFEITTRPSHLNGKANVLVQLARQAQGDYFFLTDADIAIHPQWIRTLLPYFQADVGIITGFTWVRGNHFSYLMQALDWTWALSWVSFLGTFRIPLTAMGNNMAVSRIAYEQVGGYESLPFSQTEDLMMFQAVVQAGFAFKQVVQPESVAVSEPIQGWWNLLHQRKRWMSGAMQMTWYWRVLLWIQALFLPILIALYYLNPSFSLLSGALKIVVHDSLMIHTLQKIKKIKYALLLPLYEIYTAFFLPALLLFYYLPIPTRWKDRIF
jgi:cellulose synthase/poly-beta-1,6-N-acetylglucosamine synthase-like glycosyltransferase